VTLWPEEQESGPGGAWRSHTITGGEPDDLGTRAEPDRPGADGTGAGGWGCQQPGASSLIRAAIRWLTSAIWMSGSMRPAKVSGPPRNGSNLLAAGRLQQLDKACYSIW